MLANYDALIKTFKQIVKDTMAASAPAAVCFGVVTSVEPLTILVDQKLPLTSMQLILDDRAERL